MARGRTRSAFFRRGHGGSRKQTLAMGRTGFRAEPVPIRAFV